jgi:hypothetical protein
LGNFTNVAQPGIVLAETTISLKVKGGFYDVTLVTENRFATKNIFLE